MAITSCKPFFASAWDATYLCLLAESQGNPHRGLLCVWTCQPALCHAAVLLLAGWATLFAAGLALCFPACLCMTGRDFSEVCGVPGGIGHPKTRVIPGYTTVSTW